MGNVDRKQHTQKSRDWVNICDTVRVDFGGVSTVSFVFSPVRHRHLDRSAPCLDLGFVPATTAEKTPTNPKKTSRPDCPFFKQTEEGVSLRVPETHHSIHDSRPVSLVEILLARLLRIASGFAQREGGSN